jgi:O-antigen/teichoic acid export membrane protein
VSADRPGGGAVEISARLVARNTLLNFGAQIVTLLVAVAAVPVVVRGLGPARFGVLSLSWIILSYFTVFDLGLTPATTKFAADALGRGDEAAVGPVLWTAVASQAVLGMLAAAALAALAPVLSDHLLHLSAPVRGEARTALFLLAPAIVIVLVSGSFSGLLEATQRFGLLNAVRVPANLATFALPVLGTVIGLGLPGIVAMIVATRLVALVALVALDFRLFPQLRGAAPSRALFRRLLAFGGWVVVSDLLSPALTYLDRFVVATVLSAAALGYYSAPFEVVTRLAVIPASMAMTLFPAFSSLRGREDRERTAAFFQRSVKLMLLLLAPIVVGLALWSHWILAAWLGPRFAAHGASAMSVLAIGAFVNAMAYIPYALLLGEGRPDLIAKFHMLELLPYVGVLWVGVHAWGLPGAAAAWAFRATLDATLLFAASLRFVPGSTLRRVAPAGLAGAVFAAATTLVGRIIQAAPLGVHAAVYVALVGAFAAAAWRRILDEPERRTLAGLVRFDRLMKGRR